jgi:hypothetical protein
MRISLCEVDGITVTSDLSVFSVASVETANFKLMVE